MRLYTPEQLSLKTETPIQRGNIYTAAFFV
jgi:hypothetical protein